MHVALPPHRLDALIKRDGLRLSHVAAHCDVDQSTVWRWRAGQTQIPDEQKFRLAHLFEVSVAYLMGWDQGATSDHAAPDSGAPIGKAAA